MTLICCKLQVLPLLHNLAILLFKDIVFLWSIGNKNLCRFNSVSNHTRDRQIGLPPRVRPSLLSPFFLLSSFRSQMINWPTTLSFTSTNTVDVYLLQFRLSVSAMSPQSSSSPLSGKGFTHVLLLVWFSWREHPVHSVHCVQYPLTSDKWSEHMRAVTRDINCFSVENCLRVHTMLVCITFSSLCVSVILWENFACDIMVLYMLPNQLIW